MFHFCNFANETIQFNQSQYCVSRYSAGAGKGDTFMSCRVCLNFYFNLNFGFYILDGLQYIKDRFRRMMNIRDFLAFVD